MPSPHKTEASSYRGILAGLWRLGLLCMVLQMASTAGIHCSALVNSSQAGPQKTAASAQDDLQQLDRLESQMRSGKFQEIQAPLRDYLKAHPKSARAYYYLGYATFRTHQLQVSVGALAKSLQLDLNNAEAHKILGLDLIMIGKNDEAQLEMEQAAHLEPNSAEIHYFLG